MILLVQNLLESYFCHRSNFRASFSDLIADLFSSLIELRCYLFRSYSTLIFVTEAIFRLLIQILLQCFSFSNWAMTLLVQILLDSYFWHRSNFQASYSDLIAVLFSSNWAMLLLVQILFDSYFWHRSNFQASYSDLIAVLF